MANDILAKFRCTAEVNRVHSRNADAQKTVEFTAVYDDGIPENQRFHKYTPSGRIELQVNNEAVDFEPGAEYYVTFTKVPKPGEE
jgi:hypothetical protein